jgi:hypothetical protein
MKFDFTNYKSSELREILNAIKTLHAYGLSTVELSQAAKAELNRRGEVSIDKDTLRALNDGALEG